MRLAANAVKALLEAAAHDMEMDGLGGQQFEDLRKLVVILKSWIIDWLLII